MSRCLPDGDQHRERGGYQEPAQASKRRNEARDQQRSEHEHKKAALRHMAGRKSKIKQPNSHPSNPIHKAATSKKRPAVQTAPEPTSAVQTQHEPRPPVGSGRETHENNKIALAVGATTIAALLFLALS